jgi:riboflavin kinase/FMN adenylyltransferase
MTILIRGIHNLHHQISHCVATIGNFDGLHLGHQKLLNTLKQEAKAMNLPSAVILFEPQPNEFFAQDKLSGLQKCHVDYVVCLKFDQKLADLSAEDFVNEILVEQLGVQKIIIGDDFRFGHKRSGDIHLLKQLGQRYHFTAQALDTYSSANEERISSTRIRQALQQGDLESAEKLLGKPFAISGRVVHGDKRGRQIGFPTLNILLQRKTAPISGVFVVRVFGIAEHPLKGVANVGNRPTVDGTRSVLEIHLFDFDQTIYGAQLYVEFIHKLREEKRFESFEKLKEQITLDVKQAREYFEK